MNRNIIVLDNKSIIEDFEDELAAKANLGRIRQDNPDIEGDLIVAKIIHREN